MNKIDFTTTKYRETDIIYNLYGRNEYTVQFMSDDYFFNTEKEAKKFIDDEVCALPFC